MTGCSPFTFDFTRSSSTAWYWSSNFSGSNALGNCSMICSASFSVSGSGTASVMSSNASDDERTSLWLRSVVSVKPRSRVWITTCRSRPESTTRPSAAFPRWTMAVWMTR